MRMLVVALLLIVAMAGCGGGTSDASDSTDSTRPGVARPDVGRVLALGEERVLADLLALGIRPVASTANVVVDGGFVGLDGFDTAGIEPLASTDPNIERLAAFRADVIVASEFVVDYLGRDVLDGLGRVVVVPDGGAKTQIVALGDAFDRRSEADALAAEHDTAIAEGRTALAALPEASRTVSVATVYPGPTVAAWVDGPVDVPATLLALGFALRPDAATAAGTEGGNTEGRAFLSEEQIGLFDAPTIIAMQSEHVEGEADALAAMADKPLWTGLPAVRDSRVITVDRLGYPGIAGQTRLVEDLVQKLGA